MNANTLDSKIIKYKQKIKKITNKINLTLNMKKKNHYLMEIVNLPFVLEIMDKIKKLDTNITYSNHTYNLIIYGEYSVGKTTLINNIEKILGIDNTGQKINVKIDNDLEIIKNLNTISDTKFKINYIETCKEFVQNIYDIICEDLIKTTDIQIINLIPKNIDAWKNRIINKFFTSVHTDSNINMILNKINGSFSNKVLSKNKNIFTDNDFDFLSDEIKNPYTNIKINQTLKFPNEVKFYF